MSRGFLWWAALVVPLWLVLALCCYWEPVTRDGWGNTYWYILHDLSPGKLVAYVGENWRTANPRLGQTWTLLSYWPGPFHVIVTPLLELAMFALLTTLALGRRPRANDAAVALVVTAIVCACTPQIGPMLFYRPFTGNYLFGLVLNLAWLVPYRLAMRGRWLVVAMPVLGVAAGMCNEHTGIAVLALGGFATVVAWREKRLAAWQVAGLVGLAVGYALLLVAPGHAYRYDGLAKQASMLGRVIDRGVGGNVQVIWSFIAAMLYALPWLALGIAGKRSSPATIERQERRWLIAFLVAGLLCTFALLASPKQGGRLYLASVALASIPIACFVTTYARGWIRTACLVLSAGVLAYGAARCIAVYSQVGPVGKRRVAIIRDTPDGQSVVIPRYPVGKSRWFLGEDLDERMLTALARDYGLISITFER